MRVFFFLLLLTGCSHSTVVVGNARPTVSVSNVQASGGVAAAILVGTAAVAAAEDWNNPRPVPAMAAEREVSEQDCTQPVDLTGNLRCR